MTNPRRGVASLLVGMAVGRPIAAPLSPVAAGGKSPVPFCLSRPTISFGRVVDVGVRVQLAGGGGDDELTIPPETPRPRPEPGGEARAEVGLLRGDGPRPPGSPTGRTGPPA